jgi:hypothetical protein
MTSNGDAAPLTEGEKAILKRLQKKPIELRWGRHGWSPENLPKSSKRSDFDSLCQRPEGLVKIASAQLTLTDTPAT